MTMSYLPGSVLNQAPGFAQLHTIIILHHDNFLPKVPEPCPVLASGNTTSLYRRAGRRQHRDLSSPTSQQYFNQLNNINLRDMKKILTLLIAVLIAMSSLAQSSDHLTFKGVPIDGTLNEYVSKMKQNGFTPMSSEDGVAKLNGDFAAYKNCIIGVATLKQKDLVSKITVIFPECPTWSLLSSNYFSLKEMLTEKYGKPSECMEKFQSYDTDDDNSKIFQVKMNRCKYYTTFETEKGSIQLSIENNNMACHVMLAYYDKINSEIIKAKAIDDL